MNGQPTLPTERAHDLPRFWDGKAVAWRGWEAEIEAFICPPPKPSCCPACGSFAKPAINHGRVAKLQAITHDMIAAKDAARDRLPVGLKHKIAALALYELVAFRCPDCRHDQVWERHEGTTWDLDESDYMGDGSWER